MAQADKSMWAGKVFSSYRGRPSTPSLPDQCRRLFAEQEDGWEALHHACATLSSAKRRKIDGNGGLPWYIQFNPGRVISAEAKIDVASIASRPCFLCPKHLPQEQQAILYRETFAILCNPFPIFVPHFTVAHLEHRPQNLEENLTPLLHLAKDLGPDFSVFYNGPRCGASAPDHLHFQACPAGAIPIEQEDIHKIGTPLGAMKTASLFEFRRRGRYFFLVTGAHLDDLVRALAGILSALRQIMDEGEEAMVNAIASFVSGTWRVVVFPRRKHRPDAFFRTGEDRRAVTPGAVEMGGLVVTTNDRDFSTLDASELIALFTEVSADENMMDGVVNALRNPH